MPADEVLAVRTATGCFYLCHFVITAGFPVGIKTRGEKLKEGTYRKANL